MAKQVPHRYIDIPEEIQDFYKMYRPSSLVKAYNLEKALDTPARIYYKFEGSNTSGTLTIRIPFSSSDKFYSLSH